MNKTIAGAIALAAAGITIAGCQSKPAVSASASARASSVKASAQAAASALATNPAVLSAEGDAVKKVQTCATAQGVQFSVTGTGDNTRAKVTHVGTSFVEHPFKGFDAITQCAGANQAGYTAIKACEKQLVNQNGIGSGVITGDLVGLANCVAQETKK